MPEPTGFIDQRITRSDAHRPWVVHVPVGYTPRRRWPAILFLHGRGESGSDGRRQLTRGLGPVLLERHAEWPFIVVFPQKPDEARPWADEADSLGRVLGRVARRWRIDPARCHLTGLSQGGHGTIALARRLPWRFASLVPVCGAADDVETAAAAVGQTPVWAFHGEDDPVVPASRSAELVAAIRRTGGNARLTRYPGVGHAAWELAYRHPELPRWILMQRSPE